MIMQYCMCPVPEVPGLLKTSLFCDDKKKKIIMTWN